MEGVCWRGQGVLNCTTSVLVVRRGAEVVITDDGIFIIDWAMHGLSLLRIILVQGLLPVSISMHKVVVECTDSLGLRMC